MSRLLVLTPYILTTTALCLSLPILILTTLLTSWATQPTSSYPTITVSPNPTSSSSPPPQTSTIPSFPSTYNPTALILNIIPGAGGTIDALLLFICLFSIDYIYIGRRTHLAKASKSSAANGQAPIWLWGITIFIIAFSIARSLVGFIGASVGYYSSAKFVLPGAGSGLDGDRAYVAPDGKGFSLGGWTCQVAEFVVDGDGDGGRMRRLCAQEQAARWMILPLLLVFAVLLGLLVVRFSREKRRVTERWETKE